MTYHLFLDDERHPHHVTWVEIRRDRPYEIVRNFEQFCESITAHGCPAYVTFDHDLADEHYQVMLQENSYEYDDGDMKKTFNCGTEKTGFDCAKWLVEYCCDNNVSFPQFDVHSLNPVGAERIKQYIQSALDDGYIR